MPKPRQIELADGTVIPILHEDRAVLVIDKPSGWMLAPTAWDRTGRNLQLALESSLSAGDYWARSRGLKFLRFVHRLDADTSGVLLLAKSRGALKAYSELFEARLVDKIYIGVVHGVPEPSHWVCQLEILPDPAKRGRMKTLSPAEKSLNLKTQSASRHRPSEIPKDAETRFRVIQASGETALVEAHPITGRTHQIRVHLAAAGHPVLGDALYGLGKPGKSTGQLALRAVALAYRDPFTKRGMRIEAPFIEFARAFGFNVNRNELFPAAQRQKIW
jgi:23S rRNA pseudouridine1911/1915/1917 synthase